VETVAGYIYPAFEGLRMAVNVCGVLVVAWGVGEAVWGFVRLRTVQHSAGLFVRASSIRERLGVHLLLALDIFIGADIIGTVLHPEWANVAVLAVIVAIRVVLSFLLAREIADAHSFLERNRRPPDRRPEEMPEEWPPGP
jgi:uncharacterized membrane protein